MRWPIISILLSAVGATSELVDEQHAALYPHKVLNLSGQRGLSSISHDDVIDKQGCRALTVLFAADSTEYGNVGTHTGPSFFQALSAKIGGRQKIAIQGIDYPVDYHKYNEDWDYYDYRDLEGPQMMIKLVQQVMDECPLTHLVLSGYG
jgi:cutinase